MKKLSLAISLILGTSVLAPATQAATVEVGQVEVGDSVLTIPITGFTNPVVIAGVPSDKDDAPGVVSISNVTKYSFDISFKEWPYLDGVHALEKVPYMVVEKGRHVMADGSVWEAGVQSQDPGSDNLFFSAPFDGVPVLLQTPQSQNDSDAFATRAFSVTPFAFGSKMFEQELKDGHVVETSGYVAIYNPQKSGKTDGGYFYQLGNQSIDATGTAVTYGTLSMQEEQSSDSEVSHVTEVLSVVEINDLMFAHDNSLFGGDPMTLRYTAAYDPLPTDKTGDKGNIALIGTNNLLAGNYSASYTYDPAYPPAAAFDGHVYYASKVNDDAGAAQQTGTWISVMNSGPQWIQVDFGQLAHIKGFSTQVANGFASRSAKTVVVQVSDDGVNFTDHQQIVLSQSVADVTLDTPAVGRYVRLNVLNSHEATFLQIGELEYYGSFVTTESIVIPPPPPPSAYERSCNNILIANPGSASGVYHIDPDGTGGLDSFDAYCDMTSHDGGWTLVAIREQASYPAPVMASVTDLSLTEGVLGDLQWQALRDDAQQIYAQGSTDVWALYDISTLKASTCVPLSDNLTDSVLVQVEPDCSSTGLDYSEIGSPRPEYSTALYDLSPTPIMVEQGGTEWGSGGNWANPDILYLYVK